MSLRKEFVVEYPVEKKREDRKRKEKGGGSKGE